MYRLYFFIVLRDVIKVAPLWMPFYWAIIW